MNHYPGIAYFTLAREMPGHPVGTVVNIGTADGAESLWIGGKPYSDTGIEMHIDLAKQVPEWFTPVTMDEHREICKENTILYIMDRRGCSREDAVAFEEKMWEHEEA